MTTPSHRDEQRATVTKYTDDELIGWYVRYWDNWRSSWGSEKDYWLRAVHDAWEEALKRKLESRIAEALAAHKAARKSQSRG